MPAPRDSVTYSSANSLSSIVGNRWQHVFECYRDFHLSQSGFAQFCFRCSKWLTSKRNLVAHCQGHIDKGDAPLRYNPVRFRKAIACAGYCPVHLSDTSLPADERMQQFPDQSSWQRHISRCIQQYIKSCDSTFFPCPDRRCPVTCLSEGDLWYHLGDVHSTQKPVTVGKRKTCSEHHQDKAVDGPNETKKRPIIIKVQASRKTAPICHAEDTSSPGFFRASTLDLDPNLMAIAETALSISGSASSCSNGDDDSLWDQQDDYSTGYTLLSSPPSGEASTVNLDVEESSLCSWSTPLERAIPDLSDPAWTFNHDTLTSPPYIPAAGHDLSHPDDPLSIFTNLAGPFDPVILSASTDSANDIFETNISTLEPEPIDGVGAESPSSRGEAAGQCNPADKDYPVDCLLGRWGANSFFVKWLDGTYTWEPRENILDDELIEAFEESYKGFHLGVEVLRTRIRDGKREYRLRWAGRPRAEDWWVAEKDMSPELVEKHKPSKKAKRGKRRN